MIDCCLLLLLAAGRCKLTKLIRPKSWPTTFMPEMSHSIGVYLDAADLKEEKRVARAISFFSSWLDRKKCLHASRRPISDQTTNRSSCQVLALAQVSMGSSELSSSRRYWLRPLEEQ